MAAPLPPPLLGALLVTLAVPPSSSAAGPEAAHQASAAPSVEVRLGVLLPGRNVRYPWAWPRVAPALSLALEALEPQLRPQGLDVRTAFASTENEDGVCFHHEAQAKAIDLKGSHDPDVLLGAGCYGTSYAVALFARHWQVPLLRAGAYERGPEAFSSTMVYAGPLGPALDGFLLQLLRRFNWTSRAAAVEYVDYFEFFPYVHRPSTDDFETRFHNYRQPGEAVRFIQANGRVVYITGPLKMLQEIMHVAQAQNMTSGDYVFIYLDIWGESLRAEGHREAKKPWQSKESQDMGELREAFQTVLVITFHEPQTPEYWRFQSQLILRAQRDFGVAGNDSMETLVAGCFHDVLLLYLKALNETLQEGGTKRNTSRILEKMRGLKIQGVTGTVSLNRDNDREMDFDLWAMRDVESGEFQVVAHYTGPEKQINWTGPIHWKKGSPPLDNPPCVFNMDDPSCASLGTTAASSLLTLGEQRLGPQDLQWWAGQFPAEQEKKLPPYRGEKRKSTVLGSSQETAVCSSAFSVESSDLSLEVEEGRSPLTSKKPKPALL
ncbi:atrial natriuretic peptide receptor 2-like [Heteronotia binoei]|uniref:atrial natriuretic peptide receptor 2-like n=1 Tax=Heteronotia binoei TaxID=13085 RepID=UPI002930FF8F|nr:atrial natriuretic peptide receptor 2-like [Heteronotia binoei]